MVLVVKESIVAWWSHWHPVGRGSRSHVVCPSSGEFYWTEKKLSFNSSAVSFPLLLDWKWAGLRKSFFLNRKSPLQTLWTPSWYMLLHQLWLKLIIRCTQCLKIAFSSNPPKKLSLSIIVGNLFCILKRSHSNSSLWNVMMNAKAAPLLWSSSSFCYVCLAVLQSLLPTTVQ